MRRVGNVSLAPEVEVYRIPLPTTHPAWCRYLATRGCLSQNHWGCARLERADICIA